MKDADVTTVAAVETVVVDADVVETVYLVVETAVVSG